MSFDRRSQNREDLGRDALKRREKIGTRNLNVSEDADILGDVLQKIYEKPVRIQSDFARYRSLEISVLASMGMITTRVSYEVYGRFWRVSTKGLKYLTVFWGE